MHKPYTNPAGPVLLIDRDDVDTDALYPSRFLNTTKRFGLGHCLFADWRAAGNAEFAHFSGQDKVQATVLVAGANFGCGSSREHAVWALADCGIRAVVALSFGDIFQSNCIKNGIVTAQLTKADHQVLADALSWSAHACLEVDLRQCQIKLGDATRVPFVIDAADAEQLLSGKDAIAATLEHAAQLDAYEKHVATRMPWLGPWRPA